MCKQNIRTNIKKYDFFLSYYFCWEMYFNENIIVRYSAKSQIILIYISYVYGYLY